MNTTNGCFSTKSLVNFLGLRIQSCRSSSLRFQILTFSLFMLVMPLTMAGNTATGTFALGQLSLVFRDNLAGGQQLDLESMGNVGGGNDNTATGQYSLASNQSGNDNTAIGAYSLFSNDSGGDNVAIGLSALTSNTTGAGNIGIGWQAGASNQTGSKNIFLGYRAGYSETGSNKLYIDNSTTATPLIYGDFASDALTINGTLNSTGTLTAAGIMSSQGGIVNTGTLTSTGNISTSGTLTATGNISTGGTLTAMGIMYSQNGIVNTGTLTSTGNMSTSGTFTSTGNISTSGTLTATGNVIAPAFYHTDGTKMLSMQNGSLHLGASSMIFTDSSVSGNADIMHSSSGKIQLGKNATDSTTVVGSLNVETPTQDSHAANKAYVDKVAGNAVDVDALRKDMRRYDSRSVALSAALTALPTTGGTGSHTCGVGAGVRGEYTAMAVGCAADLANFELPAATPNFIKNASINAGTSFLAHDDPDYTFKMGMSFNFGGSKSKSNASNFNADFTRELALVEQRNLRTDNKQAEAIKNVQRDNREMKRVNLKVLAENKMMKESNLQVLTENKLMKESNLQVLAENKLMKDTNLRLQAQIDDLKTDKVEMLAVKEQLAQLTALIAGSEMVAAK
jgi:hypothetical protein